ILLFFFSFLVMYFFFNIVYLSSDFSFISISKLIRIRYKLYILAILKDKNLSSLSMSVFWDWSIAYMDCMALTLICLLVNILKELTLTGKIYLMRCKNNII